MAENGYNDLEKQKPLLQEHEEKHFTSSEIVRDIIIGVSDGLTVPFALAAGLSGANVTSSIILIAGIAEVAAGAISMGLGGYTSFFLELFKYLSFSFSFSFFFCFQISENAGTLQRKVKLTTTRGN